MAISCLRRADAAVILLPTCAATAPVKSQPAPVAPQQKDTPGRGDCGGDQDGEDNKATWCGSTACSGGLLICCLLPFLDPTFLFAWTKAVSNLASSLLTRRHFINARKCFFIGDLRADYFEELVLL